MSTLKTPTISSNTSLKRSLGIPTLIIFGLAYLVPMTVFTTYGIVNEITGGFLSSAYFLTLVAMLFTAISYAVLSRKVSSAGSAYAYTRLGFGSKIGFLTGWAVLIDYILLPMLNYLLIGIYLNQQFPFIPGWVFALAALVLVTVLNILGIRAVKSANVIIVALQCLFFAVFVLVAVRSFQSGVSPLDPFIRSDFEPSPVAAGAAILCLSFLGFDAISTMAEEARDPERTVPRAIVGTTIIAGIFFIGISWTAYMAFPEMITGPEAESSAVTMLASIGGNFLTSLFLAAYVTGATGSALASQASVSRILYTMGRDSVLPKRVFGVLSRRFRTPVGAILIVAAVSLTAVFADVDTVASLVSFGALTAFSLVNLSVISVFLLRKNVEGTKSYFVHGVIPSVGFLLTVWLWTSLSMSTLAIGVCWILLGFGYLIFLTRGFKRPVPRMADA